MRSLFLVLTLVATACHGDNHTLLFLRLEAGPHAPAGVQSIDVAFTLAGRTASVTLRETPARPIEFPTSEVIEIAAGAGNLDLVAIARNDAGDELARASASTPVTAGESSLLTLTFGGSPADGGTNTDDGGTSLDDGGTTPDDGGTNADDAGNPPPDLMPVSDGPIGPLPGPPTALLAGTGLQGARLDWTPPTDDGGSPILRYVVTSTPDNLRLVVAAPATTVFAQPLRASVTYTFTVHAENANGAGPESLPSNAVSPIANLARYALASAGTTFSGYAAKHINDGDRNPVNGPSTSWCNADTTLPTWVELDFGETRSPQTVYVLSSTGLVIQDYDLQLWDGTTWNTAAVVTGNADLYRAVDISGHSGSKLRLFARKGSTTQPQYARINELEVY